MASLTASTLNMAIVRLLSTTAATVIIHTHSRAPALGTERGR
jgi:hypothetical protein